jgi:hypothetical protein
VQIHSFAGIQHSCRLHVATRKNTVRRMIGQLECGLVSLTKHHPVNVSQATYSNASNLGAKRARRGLVGMSVR